MIHVGLDFETYGDINLPDHGLDRYVRGKHFTPLIASVAWFRSNVIHTETVDFMQDFDAARDRLKDLLDGVLVCAHNAPFEAAVCDWLGIKIPMDRWRDSAVIARAMGAGGKLEAAAPQLLGVNKMEDGWPLIKLFSIPSKERLESGDLEVNRELIDNEPDKWHTFKAYCELDAELSLELVDKYAWLVPPKEWFFQELTMRMNVAGWPVDLPSVQEMQRRYQENLEFELQEFRNLNDAADLNLNSLPQLKEWCAKRGIKAKSFNEDSVAKLRKKINAKLDTMSETDDKYWDYVSVVSLLETKQLLGGSSLKKLKVLLDTTSQDRRLRDQYMHIGAGQTWRTTGRSVQMQNLKRLLEPADMETLMDDDVSWSNAELAENIRQLFTSSKPGGAIIVGDFSSVESRGLAWWAGAAWKLREYEAGRDMYKVLALKIYPGLAYDAVTKSQRTTGKVGELSCGYGAGPDAVESFAEGMGVDLSNGEAAMLVRDWRAANPEVVKLWDVLDAMLHNVVELGRTENLNLMDGYRLRIEPAGTPATLAAQAKGVQSIAITVFNRKKDVFMRRFFHGCYARGRNICYHKPSDKKGGDLWSATFMHPKTKQTTFYSVYGGKLSGILTQSFCRELFFMALERVCNWADKYDSLTVIGQFHDEIVMDWVPGDIGLDDAKQIMEELMSDRGDLTSFPLGADVKHGYRYIK